MRWNDASGLEERLARGDVAAVIMEPIMFNAAGIEPLPGYLESVREACTRTGTILIFDEVITGFRVAPGGVQERKGVVPDLTVLGKALANGFPVAALVGRADLMSYFGDRRVLHGGTYNTQSVSMAATVATLRAIQDGALYETIDRTGSRLMNGLGTLLLSAGLDAAIVGYPAVFNIRLGAVDAHDYRGSLAANRSLYGALAVALLERGIRVLPRGTWFVSEAHTDEVIDETLAAFEEALAVV